MAATRQFELMLVRLVPHALRDDFMTVGFVVVEDSHQPSADSLQPSAISLQEERFADLRFTRDWKRVECFAPELELEILEYLEREVRAGLREIRGRADLLRLVEERFGAVFDVGPVKALVAVDPVAEMRVLERDYLEPMQTAERGRGSPRHTLGRLGIVRRMESAFADAGVLELLQRDLDMREFTGASDPFTVDFGFRVGRSLKMFHALALNMSREPAVTLAYRFGRIRDGMRGRGDEALMTAIINDEMVRRGELDSGIAMLRANEIAVRGVGEIGEIAGEVKREFGA